MDVMELLEELGRVAPVRDDVLDRTARTLLVSVRHEGRRHDPTVDFAELVRPEGTGVDGPLLLSERRNGTVDGSRTTKAPSPAEPRRKAYLVALAAAVVLLAVVGSVAASRRSPTAIPSEPPVGSSMWRLVSAVIPPFQALASGGQTGLQCVTDQVCYSPGSGEHGAELLRTGDGGLSWQPTAPVPGVLQESGISFSCSNAETCVVNDSPENEPAGQLATLAITTDGGAHWTTSTVPAPSGVPNPEAGSLDCADAVHCVIAVDGSVSPGGGAAPQRTGTFMSTSDGGKTWAQATSVPAVPAGSVWTMNCTSDGSCLAVSLVGQLASSGIVGLSSHDWGSTWVAGPTTAAPNGGGILYASCGDATHCMLVFVGGPSSDPYQIITTTDGGQTWHVSGPPAGWLNMPTALSCATAQDCWIAMAYYSNSNPAGAYSMPVIEETRDGGASWSSIPLPKSKPPIADVLTLSCPPSGDGCMGIGNRQDHFVLPPLKKGKPVPLSGPLVISNLPGRPS